MLDRAKERGFIYWPYIYVLQFGPKLRCLLKRERNNDPYCPCHQLVSIVSKMANNDP